MRGSRFKMNFSELRTNHSELLFGDGPYSFDGMERELIDVGKEG
jgi:hypothetical protein